MKKIKNTLYFLLLPIILIFTFYSFANAATKIKTKSFQSVISLGNKKGNYEILGKSIIVVIDGKNVYSGTVTASSKSRMLKTANIKDITIKNVIVDITKNRAVPIIITVGDKAYNTYVKSSYLKHFYFTKIKVSAQYNDYPLKGFIWNK